MGKLYFHAIVKHFSAEGAHINVHQSLNSRKLSPYLKIIGNSAKKTHNQDQQRRYILDYVDILEPQRRRGKNNSRRQNTYLYFIALASPYLIKVCRYFVISIHGITEKFVRVAVQKRIDNSGFVKPDCHGYQPAINKSSVKDAQFARNHILSVPAVESHYCPKYYTKYYYHKKIFTGRIEYEQTLWNVQRFLQRF